MFLEKVNRSKGKDWLFWRKKWMDNTQAKTNEIYKILGCKQADKIDVKRVMERVKK